MPADLKAKAYDSMTALVAGVVGVFSPGRAISYREARDFLRTYVAGELTGPNQNWRPTNRSADSEIKRGHRYVMARARDQAQNNAYIAGGLEKICNNVVRRGIPPQARIRLPNGKQDQKLNKKIERDLWSRWVRYADITGHNSFYAIQRLVLRHLWVDGEVLIHRVWDWSLKGIVPLRLEIIECDHLDGMVDGQLDNGNIARRGIEFSAETGKPVAYHLYEKHPGDYQNLGALGSSRRIPAEDITHIFDKRRASQTRGISWLAAILIEAYDLSDYKTYERIGAKLAAAFGIFIKSSAPSYGGGAGIGIPGNSQMARPGGTEPDPKLPDFIEAGRIQRLPRDTEIQVASHNRPGTQFEPFIRDSVRGQSTGTGMSYEAYSNDYSSASYSSARSASLEERLSYRGQQGFLNEKLNDKVWAWFIEAAFVAGLLPELRDYAVNKLPAHEAVSWQDPGWHWVDPLKDSKAADTGIANVTTTRTRVAAANGEEWDELLEEALTEEEKLAKLYELRRQNASAAKGEVA